MRILLPAVFALALVACSDRTPPNAEKPSEVNASQPDEQLPSERYLVLVARAPDAVELIPIRIDDGRWERRSTISIPAPEGFSEEYDEGRHHRLVVAQSSTDVLVAFSRMTFEDRDRIKRSVATTVVARSLTRPDEAEIRFEVLNLFATALAASNNAWLIGARRESGDASLAIDRLEISESKQSWSAIWRKGAYGAPGGGGHGKEIDAFCRDGSELIAIDDVVRPKFAVHLAERDSVVAVVGELDLPSGANERYITGALSGDRFVALSSYSHGSSQGHRLRRFTLKSGELVETAKLVEYVPRAGSLGDWENRYELVPDKAVLLGGKEFTRWTEVVIHEGRVLVSAGTRGVLEFGIDEETATPKYHDVGGDCLDLKVVDGQALALVREGDRCRLTRLVLRENSELTSNTLADVPLGVEYFAD